MSVFIDRTFLLRISAKLSKFSQKKQDLYNFRCPICGDSQKNKTKCRGYVYRKKNDYFYSCHNCGISTTFYNFLERVDPSLIKEYSLERYKNGETGNNNYKKPDFEEFKTEKPTFKQKLNLESIEDLPDGHYAKEYVKNRLIPESNYSSLYFAPDFKQFVESLNIDKSDLKEDDPRLVIPFYDKDKNLVAFQGRALGESKMRYITIKVLDSEQKLFGIDRIDEEKMIYVVEGPIDSLFIDNAIATADSNLSSASHHFDKSKITLIFDNEPRNKEICKLLDKAIENHYNVVIWPDMIDSKDINDMAKDGWTKEELEDIISKNTFVNLRAKAEYIRWKKI
jgi:transcription elongation factor Elf1